MPNQDKINKLLERSRGVILDTALENGAIIAANTDKKYYPRGAKNYHYVWPRDAAFICVAAQVLGIKNIQEPFFEWLLERPEDFKKEGMLFANYSTNGRKEVHQFQPDQAGAMLWAIKKSYSDPQECVDRWELLIRRLADGLSKNWKGQYFFSNATDLWEEGHRRTSTKVENNHTYSLAACVRGLRDAHSLIDNDEWKKTADQMMEKINEAYMEEKKTFVRTHGKIDDFNMDASLLGLVYPFSVVESDDERMVNTVNKMEKTIVINGGVHRYQFDYYDGEGSAQEGAGGWPLLNAWMSIYWSVRGNKEKALQYYNWIVERSEEYDFYIPEQIFDDYRVGIYPLAWSHAMFVLATEKLGLLNKK